MSKFRIFYDYECPFCKRGFEELMDLLPAFPEMEIEWRPIEAHPRPEESRPHTDLCVQAYYAAAELGAEMDSFHRAMFQGVAIERRDVEKAEVLAELLKGIVERAKFLEILKSGKYASSPGENNDLAYEKNEVWYLPAFRYISGKKSEPVPRLDAKGGSGVSREEIKAFLEWCQAPFLP